MQSITLGAGSGNTRVDFDVIDDMVLEIGEEGFLALIELESAQFPDLVQVDTNTLTLARIRDNDGKLLKCDFHKSEYVVVMATPSFHTHIHAHSCDGGV